MDARETNYVNIYFLSQYIAMIVINSNALSVQVPRAILGDLEPGTMVGHHTTEDD